MNEISLKRLGSVTLGLIVAAHVWSFSYQPGINNPNENVRFYMTAAMVEDHTYAIDGMRARWGWTNDAAVKDGKAFSVKAPGTSELGIPAYAAYHAIRRVLGLPFNRALALGICRYLATLLPALAFVVFYRRFLRSRTPEDLAPDTPLLEATLLSIFVGSPWLAYSTAFMSHVPSAICAFLAFALLLRAHSSTDKSSPGLGFAAGLCAAGTTYFEYPQAPVSIVLAGFALYALPWKRWPWFVFGSLIPVLLIMHFQWKAFGSPFSPGHHFVEDPAFRAQHRSGLFGLNAFHWEALSILWDPGFGLFPMTPLFALAPIGVSVVVRRRGQRMHAFVGLLCILLPILANVTFANWRGGWTVGPRHIIPAIPFVAWFAYEGLLVAHRRMPTLTVGFVLASTLTGLLLSGIPSLVYPHVPPYFDRPVPQLFFLLLRHDYAPLTVLALAGVYGSLALAPLLIIPVWILAELLRHARRRLSMLGCAAGFLALMLFLPLRSPPTPSPDIRRGIRFITSTWSPPGHDRVSRLREAIRRSPDPQHVQRLGELLRREGRDEEAAALGR